MKNWFSNILGRKEKPAQAADVAVTQLAESATGPATLPSSSLETPTSPLNDRRLLRSDLSTTFEKLRSIICEQLGGIDPAEVTPNSSIRDDLGGDDDDIFLLAMSIEEEFGISIGAPQEIKTVADTVSAIEKHQNCGQSPAEFRFWSLKNSVMRLECEILRATQHGDFESVASLKAQRRSLKPALEAIENNVRAELPEWYLKGMQSYGDKHDKHGDSTIEAFDLGPDSFVVLLKDGSVYLLNRDNVGENNVDSLKTAALRGQEIDNDFNWMRKKSQKLR